MISEQIGLDLLRTYVAVCRQGSLSRVAAQTGRTQSALSMQMRRLEGLVDRRLFQRTGRGVVPTAEGELFLGYATRILALGDEAVSRLRRGEVSGVVRIGMAEEVTTALLPTVLERLHCAYPDIRLDVDVKDSLALGRSWPEGELDVMIVPGSTLAADALVSWTVEMRWVCTPDRLPDPERPLDIVTFAPPCLLRRRMIEALAAAGREHRMVFSSQSVTAVQFAIERGLGVGLLPPEAIRPGVLRVLRPAVGVPEVLSTRYGLYARDRRTSVVEAAVAVIREAIPAPLA